MPKSKSRPKERRRGYLPPPRKKKRKHSPKWYGYLILGVMVAGVLVIVLNYMGLMPGATSSKWLWIGLGMIALGFVGATRWS